MGLTFGLFPLGGIEFITLYMLSPELVDSENEQITHSRVMSWKQTIKALLQKVHS